MVRKMIEDKQVPNVASQGKVLQDKQDTSGCAGILFETIGIIGKETKGPVFIEDQVYRQIYRE